MSQPFKIRSTLLSYSYLFILPFIVQLFCKSNGPEAVPSIHFPSPYLLVQYPQFVFFKHSFFCPFLPELYLSQLFILDIHDFLSKYGNINWFVSFSNPQLLLLIYLFFVVAIYFLH